MSNPYLPNNGCLSCNCGAKYSIGASCALGSVSQDDAAGHSTLSMGTVRQIESGIIIIVRSSFQLTIQYDYYIRQFAYNSRHQRRNYMGDYLSLILPGTVGRKPAEISTLGTDG